MDRDRRHETRRVRRCSRSPWTAAARPSDSSQGTWVNPVWSPDGKLIVYAGQSFVGQVALRGVRPDGSAVELPPVLARPGGYRFLPDGTGLVYLPRIQSLDFWLLDFATKQSRQLTRSAIRAPCGRSTSRLTGNTSCSTARGRTRTSS